MEERTIRWGIVGLGKIAQKFADDLALVNNAQLVAVASSNLERAQAFAQHNHVATYYDSYEGLFNDKQVEVVYIASTHPLHASLSIAAMKHKKHVLCEKPIAINTRELEVMIKTAREQQTFLMEAFWSRFNPSLKKVKELVEKGELGPIRYINADFSFYALDWDKKSRLLNTELGGGTLLDIGLYPIFLSYLILGLPLEVISKSKFFDTGAEIQTSMIFDYPNAQALLYSGFASDTQMVAKISGEKGEILIDSRWHETQGFTLIKEGVSKHFAIPTIGKGYTHEILETHQCLANGQLESTLWSHQNSRDITSLLDKIRAENKIEFPFES